MINPSPTLFRPLKPGELPYNRNFLRFELGRDEGVKLRPYFDSKGIKTWGIGHNLIALPLPFDVMKATMDDVERVFWQDVGACEEDLDRAVPWWRQQSDIRQRVLLNMIFNMGLGTVTPPHAFLSFGRTLSAIQRGDYATAAANIMVSKLHRDTGPRAVRLANALQRGGEGQIV